MQTSYYIQEGLIVKKNSDKYDKYGLFSLDKWLKKLLKRLGVPFNDPCCTAGTDDNANTNLPIYFNQVTGHFYYVNPTTGNPVQITGF